MQPHEIPLFPLQTVLFPGGWLPLRIFEQRYLSLVRDCTQSDSGFGVCLIAQGKESGEAAVPHAVGTLASIVDWYTLEDGILGIATRGEARFHAGKANVDHQGLMRARVDWLPEPAPIQLAVEYSVLAQILSRLMERVQHQYKDFTPDNLENAARVGYRLAELLPLDLVEKQSLLELIDPELRLDRLLQLIPKLQGA